MTVFPFPPDFPGLSVPFSVVGFDWDSGAPDGELLVLPRGCEALAFDGPVFAPDAAFDDDRLTVRRTPRQSTARSGWTPSARAGRSAAA